MSTKLLQLEYAGTRPTPPRGPRRSSLAADTVCLCFYSLAMLLVGLFLCFAVGHP